MPDTPTRRNFIAGHWTTSRAAAVDVVNPATGDVVARIPDTAPDEVDAAVQAARQAFDSWRYTNPFQRASLLHAIGRQIEQDGDEVALEITREMGKPLTEASGEVAKLGEAFHYYAEETTRVYGQTVPNSQDGFLSVVEGEPIGVVAAITPWNYPVELIGWKLAAALGAGCTIVVKPSEYSPTSAVRLFGILERAELPPGVANLVLGAGKPGESLVSHRLVDKIAFTGSAETGAAITRAAGAAIPMSMELGGSCPLIVTAQADLDDAVAGVLRRGFRNAGQICIAVNRVYVHASLYDPFLERLGAAVAALRVGDGLADPTVDLGPVANQEILDRADTHVTDAMRNGARLVTGGSRIDHLAPGLFYQPTVLADVTPEMLLGRAETFGPVVGVTPFHDLVEAIGMANATSAGLAAYAYTRDLGEAMRLGRELDFGSVAVNNVDAGIMNAPYGGRKGSGHGSEHGKEGLEEYLHLKHLRIRYAQ